MADVNARTDLDGNVVGSGNTSIYPGPGGQHGGGLKTKTLRRMLKKAGLKTTGKKATLRARCKKAKLMRGGYPAGMGQIAASEEGGQAGGRRSRRRRSLFRKFF